MFTGFPPEALTFLKGLERNNDREWFTAHKDTFETKVKQPMIELVEAVNAELLKFAPQYINDPKKAIYRIYRDTRFSNDKTPYKTHIAAVFPRRGLDRHTSAGFYFHLSPKDVCIAAGAYMPGPEQLLPLRTWLAENHAAFRKAAKAPEKLMGKLGGESLKRPPKGFVAGHPAEDLIRMKSWLYWVELDTSTVESAKLLQEVVKRFQVATPVVDLLNTPLL